MHGIEMNVIDDLFLFLFLLQVSVNRKYCVDPKVPFGIIQKLVSTLREIAGWRRHCRPNFW